MTSLRAETDVFRPGAGADLIPFRADLIPFRADPILSQNKKRRTLILLIQLHFVFRALPPARIDLYAAFFSTSVRY
jgi:hypothetical protein